MNKIIYLNRNLQTRDVDLEDLERFKGHLFVEDAFVICVIINGFPLTSILNDLTPLERYAMASNGFDYLSLQEKDFRLSNTFFRIDYRDLDYINRYISRTYLGENENENNQEPAPALKPTIPLFTVPVRKDYNPTQENVICINPTFQGKYNVFSLSGNGNDAIDPLVVNSFYEANQVFQVCNLFFYFSGMLPTGYDINVCPFENTFQLTNGDWKYITDTVDASHFSSGKGLYLIYENTDSGVFMVVSTTPLDSSVSTLIPANHNGK